MLLHEFTGFFTRHSREGASKQERFAHEFLTLHLPVFASGTNASLLQLLNQSAVRRLGKKLGNSRGDLEPDFGHLDKLLFFCRSEFPERGKMLRKQLSRSFPYELDADRVDESCKELAFACFHFLEKIAFGLFCDFNRV